MEVKIEFISQELIKPSSPTPLHLRQYRFSSLDQIQLPVWMPFVFFYSKKPNANILDTCANLKKSLSKALTIFYPLAGRINNDTHLDCNDEGILFVEARSNCRLSDILQNPNPSDNNKFLPLPLNDCKNFVAFIQLTFLECGGFALSFTMSHKLGDALSKMTFLNYWAALTRGDLDSDFMRIPPLDSFSVFPPRNLSGYDTRGAIAEDAVTRKFTFDASVISAFKAKYTDKNGGHDVSRVDALTAFMWSRLMAATQASKTENKTYSMLHAVNLRPIIEPVPLSNQYFGNIMVVTGKATADMNAEEDDCYGVVSQMRNALRNVNGDFVKGIQTSDSYINFHKERIKKLISGNLVEFIFSSLSRLPIYEIDFGWGKPTWVGSARLLIKNFIIFIDTKDGKGIEAWVNLGEEVMAALEKDKELLAHGSSTSKVNPFVLETYSRL